MISFFVLNIILVLYNCYSAYRWKNIFSITFVFYIVFFLRFYLFSELVVSGVFHGHVFNYGYNEHLRWLYDYAMLVLNLLYMVMGNMKPSLSFTWGFHRRTNVFFTVMFFFVSIYSIAYYFYLGEVPFLAWLSGKSILESRLAVTYAKDFDYETSMFYGANIIVYFLAPTLGIYWVIKRFVYKDKNWIVLFGVLFTLFGVLYSGRKSQFATYLITTLIIVYNMGYISSRKLYLGLGSAFVIVMLFFYLYGYGLSSDSLLFFLERTFVQESASSYLQYSLFYEPEGYKIETINFPLNEMLTGKEFVNLKHATFEALRSNTYEQRGGGNAQGFSMLFLLIAFDWLAYVIFFLISFLSFYLFRIIDLKLRSEPNLLDVVFAFSILSLFQNYFGVNILSFFNFPLFHVNFIFLIAFLSLAGSFKLIKYR